MIQFENALRDTKRLKAEFPWSTPLQSVIDQLEYLIAIESGRSLDTSKLASINIGVIAAREVEDMNIEIANKLYAVSEVVRKMIESN